MFVVTGGGSGIGRALAQALAQREQSVLIVGRRKEALLETASFSSRIDFICADVSRTKGREQLFERLRDVPIIQGLVHNAGIVDPILPLSQMQERAWRQVMATNVEAPLFLSLQLNDQLRHGRVLHIGSGAAYFPVQGWSAYCVSKAALSMLTRCWQLESKEIAFASVMPGIIDTPMQAVIRDAAFMDEKKQDFFKQLKQEQRLISADTVALFLSWLLLDIETSLYVSKEWDIYDTEHHGAWLVPPHSVPAIN